MNLRSPILLIFAILSGHSSFSLANANTLIFGKTIRQIPHGEILPIAGPGLEDYLSKNGCKAQFTQDISLLTESNLNQFDVLILIDVSEGVLNFSQQRAIESFFKNGHGIVAVHASISAGKDWPWFQDMLGTKFIDHAPIQNGVVRLAGLKDPLFSKLSTEWTQFDEWFDFTDQILAPREIIYLSDESTYVGGKMGKVHPIAWRIENVKGRFFYTSMGHPADLYSNGENSFLKMILAAVRWTAKSQ